MPRQPEQLLASPPLIFDPPPRRTYDYLSDGDAYCLEPRRSTDTDRVLKHRNSTPKAEGREPGRGVKPRPMVARPAARRSRRKHSKQDLETQRNTEDASATYWQDDRQNEAEGPGLAESHAHIVVDSDVSEDTEERPSSEYELELNEEAGLSALLQDVKEQGPGSVSAFRAALAEGQQPLRSVKLCFVGHARAGKTSTLRALAERSFDPEQPSTHGVETCTLAKELWTCPEDAEVAPCWKTLDGLDVARLFEEKVAMTVADNMKAQASRSSSTSLMQEDAQEDRHSVSDHAEACSPGGAGPMKMPLDLIARAISTGAESTCSAVDKVVMQTWDFAGQQMYYNMAHVFMTAIGIYVLVLDLSAWSRGDATPMDLTESMDFWLAALLVHAADARLVLVGSHADLLDDSNRKEVYKKIDDYLAKNLQHNRILGNEQDDLLFFPVDNRRCTDSGLRSIQHLRNELSKLALEVAEEMGTIPTRWAHLFHVLEGMEADCISLESCRAMGAELGIGRGELEECLGRFHRLGQLLYFQGSPSVVLKPQWLLDAMAQVVGCPVALRQDPLRARKLKQGGLTEELLQVLWQDEKFRGHQPVLQAFLEHFDLLVPGEKGWLVPNLLPLRPQQSDCNQEAVTLILDFKGAFGRLLPTLIPRLLCQLRKRPELKLKVFEVFRDWARLSLFDPALLVTFDLYPAACPEVLRLQAVTRSAQRLKELLDSVHLAMQAWLPQVAYSTNLPCPCGAVQRDHLLDLTKLLREEPFLCPSTNNLVSPNSEIIRSWRELEAGEKSAASSGPAPAAMYYLYASPLKWHGMKLQQLGIAQEMEALQGRWVARAATCEALQEALQTRPAVLHISAHTFSARRLLLLEDGVSQAHELNVEQLEKMGPWKELGVLVLHCCGSQWLAEHLGCRALCCSEEVDDRAVCVFCRSFYLWLPEGLHTAFERAKNALGFGPDVGLRAEAKKFVLLPGKKDFSLGPCLGTGVAWPKLPRIQDYFCEVQTMLQIAAALSDEGRRRAILLLGGPGYGKTAFCREFGYHYSGPGRLFGNRVGFAGGQALSRSPQLAQDLEEMVRHGDERQLLVIDDVHLVEDKEGLRCALEGMLQRHHALRLLLTSRQMLGGSWAMLDHGKVVQVHTPVLSTEDCAELFLRRSHRILRFGDFEEGGSKEVVERLKAKELLQSLDWLKALRHMPGRLVEWAAVVNTSLPSLLKHPFLASEAEARGKRW